MQGHPAWAVYATNTDGEATLMVVGPAPDDDGARSLAWGVHEATWAACQHARSNVFAQYGEGIERLYHYNRSTVRKVGDGKDLPLLTCLVTGPFARDVRCPFPHRPNRLKREAAVKIASGTLASDPAVRAAPTPLSVRMTMVTEADQRELELKIRVEREDGYALPLSANTLSGLVATGMNLLITAGQMTRCEDELAFDFTPTNAYGDRALIQAASSFFNYGGLSSLTEEIERQASV